MALTRKQVQDQVEHRILAIAGQIETEMDLGWQTIVHKFDPRVGDDRIVCETSVDWQYRQTSCLWNVELCAGRTDDELVETMVHEFVHILIAPLWEAVGKKKHELVNEFSVENVARAILAVRNHA